MTILEFFKTVHPSVLAAKMIFRHLKEHYPVLKISDIADTTSGGTPNRGMPEYYNGDIPWVKSGELKDGLITTCDERITEAGLKYSSAKLFPKGTLLVAMYGANIGKTGVLDFDATTNQAVCAIFPKVDISRDFLFWYFKQQRIDFIAIGKGGAQPNISQTVINNASIVVPKPDVQSKIVNFLERIEKGEGIDYNFFIPDVLEDVKTIYKYKNSYIDLSESFADQLTQLENLNQAILQEAVQGKLVKQDPKDEPASELLKRIKMNRVGFQPDPSDNIGLKPTETAINRTGFKPRPIKELPPIKPEEIPFEIPENWVWCRLGEIANHSLGKMLDVNKNRGELKPYLRNINVQWFKFDLSDIKNMKFLDSETDKYSAIKGDILICEGGYPGRAAIWEDEDVIMFQKALHRVRFVNRSFNEKLFVFYLWLISGTDFFKSYLTGSGIQHFTGKKLNILPIPLPPLSEQKRIVEEIEKQFAKTKQLKEHIMKNQAATEQLLKALLHQAFELKENEEDLAKA